MKNILQKRSKQRDAPSTKIILISLPKKNNNDSSPYYHYFNYIVPHNDIEVNKITTVVIKFDIFTSFSTEDHTLIYILIDMRKILSINVPNIRK